ncbi:MAG TPA: TlpA disulfide reductase family protein [Candidatus Competibacteraceae bacterium]|nr:TlpA disulfide reductase family protein [Candidatus Competibacteraceae bacterium]
MRWLVIALVIVGLAGCQRPAVPDLGLPGIDGRRIELTELRGRPYLLVFWATSCAVCVKEIPELVRLYQELAPRGVELVAVAMSYDPPSRVVELSRRLALPYPVVLDLDGAAARALGNIQATPTTVLVGADGTVRQRILGEPDFTRLRRELLQLLPPA